MVALQDDGRVSRKAHKRRGRSISRRDRRAIRAAPRGRSDQPSSTDSTTDDLSFDSGDEEFEGEDKLMLTDFQGR